MTGSTAPGCMWATPTSSTGPTLTWATARPPITRGPSGSTSRTSWTVRPTCTARHVLVALHLAISPSAYSPPRHNPSTSTHLHASRIYPQPSTSTEVHTILRLGPPLRTYKLSLVAAPRPPNSPPTPALGIPSAGVLCQANQIFGTTDLPDETAAVNAVFSGHTNFTARVVKLGVHAQVVNK